MAECHWEWSWMLAAGVGAATLWQLLCAWLRARRAKLIAAFSPVEDANTLHKLTTGVEFPFLANMSLQFALFRSYAVPSISKILARTGNFAANAAKRADDTEILLRESTSHHVDSDRGTAAIRRLNYIHSQYPDIRNEDYLYVLALFIMEPMRWISKYGYRPMTTAECVANFIVWRDMGVRMGIKNIPAGIEEFEQWQLEYEASQMLYSATNRTISDATIALLLQPLPKLIHPVVRRLIFAMLDDRLRIAFGYPKQPQWLTSLAKAALKLLNGTCVAVLLPPRPLAWAVDRIHVDVSEDGELFDLDKPRMLAFDRYHANTYPRGYKIAEVGPGKPGALGDVCRGDLLCPLSQRYFETPWPPGSDEDAGRRPQSSHGRKGLRNRT